jgi:hypothetical protein
VWFGVRRVALQRPGEGPTGELEAQLGLAVRCVTRPTLASHGFDRAADRPDSLLIGSVDATVDLDVDDRASARVTAALDEAWITGGGVHAEIVLGPWAR